MKKSNHRIDKGSGQSLRNWEKIQSPATKNMRLNAFVEMGWGRLVFAHTFDSNKKIIETMCDQGQDTRDIAMYVIDPHVALSMAPDRLFLDPSHTFRLWHYDYQPDKTRSSDSLIIQRLSSKSEAMEINRIYSTCHMKGADPEFVTDKYATKSRTYLIAKTLNSNRIVGTVTGVDHVAAFNDPENGASLWSLAVDPQSNCPGVGTRLVRHLVEHYFTKGRAFVDVSVMHNNKNAIELYSKLGFHRIPAFCIKRKNSINEALYLAPPTTTAELNPYAKLIVDEARKRGIFIEVIDNEMGLFSLTLGSRTVTCRESLSEMTSAVAMTKCDNKRLTRQLVTAGGIKVPPQIDHTCIEKDVEFMKQVGRVVVKPVRGEQGAGISVDISRETQLKQAVSKAEKVCSDVILEGFVEGDDLRVIVINHEVVAAAVRKPPCITGTGTHTIKELMDKYNRRRMAATGGESKIPADGETLRILELQGYDYDAVLEKEKTIKVRKTANLHTGGTIHDVTPILSEALCNASITVSKILDIPVTGLDFIVPNVAGDDYAFIEANERPGLANHEPQPTARRFIDFLFPETVQIGIP